MRLNHVYWFSYYNLESPSVRYRGKYALKNLRALKAEQGEKEFSILLETLKNIGNIEKVLLT